MNENCLWETATDLIYLLSCAVNETKPDTDRCTRMKLNDIYSLSKRHMLTSITAIALEQAVELPLYFKEAKFKAIRKLSLFEIERNRVLRSFEENGIWYLPLKGIILGQCYPKVAMREMSDNDILCDADRMEDIRRIMRSLGYTCERFHQGVHDIYSKPPTVEFEMHRALFGAHEAPLFTAYYRNVKDKLVQDDSAEYGYHMTNEDFYIYLLSHMFKHYSNGGTGLCSLLDIYVFYRKYGGSFDTVYLNGELEKLQIKDFELKLRSLALKVFTGGDLSRDETKELRYLIESNRYGTVDNALEKRLHNSDSAKSKLGYALRRTFPSDEYVRLYYPFVSRHKVLYPFLVVYRPVRSMIVYRKRLSREIKHLIRYKSKEVPDDNSD